MASIADLGDLAAGVYLSEPPPLLGFCLGWSSNFVGSVSGQIQSVELLQNMVSNRAQHPPPPPPSHTLSGYYSILYFAANSLTGQFF
jgi:hypothetical protein